MHRRDLLILTAAVPALAQNTSWKPQVFDAHQNETVVALTELIIPATDTPGAKAALVNRYIDLLLLEGPAAERERFLEGLAFLDGYCIRRFAAPFVKCPVADQTTVLEAFDANTTGDTAPGHRFFRMAKQLTSRIYYSTQIGYAELNKGGRVPIAYGCTHPEHQA
ncbi:MAG: gluconate 2-dehydrogenase subunit 3 family protein [Acidobacteria bacterium]|nr:gluconate 2-dehydrogenase subunit 3 family protein [Acidobacteriota bacterium]